MYIVLVHVIMIRRPVMCIIVLVHVEEENND